MKGAIIKVSYGQGKLFPSIEAMKGKVCSARRGGVERRNGHTPLSGLLLLSLGLCREWRKVKVWQARVGLWASCNRRGELRKKLAWQELWIGKRRKLTLEGQLEQLQIREDRVWCRRVWGESLILSLSAVVMTHFLDAAVRHFEHKPMLKLYDRSNLGGGELSSVL